MREKKTVIKKICGYFFSGVFFALLLVLVVWFLYYFNIFKMPDFIVNFFGGKAENIDTSYYDEQRFYEFLEKNGVSRNNVDFVILNNDNTAHFLNALEPCDNYQSKLIAKRFYEENVSEYKYTVWKDGTSWRVDCTGEHENTTTVRTGETTVSYNNLTGESRTINGDTDFTLENAVNIADVKQYINSLDTKVEESRLVTTDSAQYLYVKFNTEAYNKIDEFYVSLDYGVVLSATSEIRGKVVFSQITESFEPFATDAASVLSLASEN